MSLRRALLVEVAYALDLSDVNWHEMWTTLIADSFHNGRTTEQLRRSFENSHTACVAYHHNKIIGTARVLSDGVCNAYLVDVWTYTPYRRQGIARTMINKILARLPGQHVYLFSDDLIDFYKRLGFVERPVGLELVVGEWLNETSS